MNTTLNILILEDDNERMKLFRKHLSGHIIYHVDNVEECKSLLTEDRKFDFVFLDHDLGGEIFVESGGDKPTGYDVAKWLSEKMQEDDFHCPLAIFVHSLNPKGRENIMNALKDSGLSKDVGFAEAPFIWQQETLSEDLLKVFEQLTKKD